MPEWIPIVATLLVGALSAVVGYAAVSVSRRQVTTQQTDVFTDAAVLLITPLRDRITELEAHVNLQDSRFHLLEQELEAAMRWGHALSAQLHDAMIDPITFQEIRRLDP